MSSKWHCDESTRSGAREYLKCWHGYVAAINFVSAHAYAKILNSSRSRKSTASRDIKMTTGSGAAHARHVNGGSTEIVSGVFEESAGLEENGCLTKERRSSVTRNTKRYSPTEATEGTRQGKFHRTRSTDCTEVNSGEETG